MLVRAFRVTDRLGNAGLRITAWAAMIAAEQTALLKRGIFGLIAGFLGAVVLVFRLVMGMFNLGRVTVVGTAQTAQQMAGATADAVETTAHRRQERMAQKAAEAELKTQVVRDPLLAQNRALSAFAVLLLLILLTVVVVQTTEDQTPTNAVSGGLWPQAQETRVPTAIFPTEEPTPTPVPDPLRVGGSLVFAQREHGQDDLWAISVGQSAPLRLTNSPADERDPAWSPDGTRIAFSSNREGNWELYILEIGTGTITRLTYSQGFEGAPSWSPDGAWLAYEGYYPETEDLDIWIISSDPVRAAAEGASRATFAPGPDIEPAWSPGAGRAIAFTSWRTGNQDIFVLSLDAGDGDAGALNLTNTPGIHEDYPAWNHDGNSLAYSAVVDGVEGVYVTPAGQPAAQPILVGRGRMPAWAPNDGSIAYLLDVGQGNRRTQILAGAIGSFGAATDASLLDYTATDPHWTNTPLPLGLVQSGGVPPSPEVAGPLYEEIENIKSDGLYGLATLFNVNVPQPYLSDRVNDSFEAMRQRVLQKTGYDFFGTLEDAWWHRDRPPEPGEPRENWHYTGRAIAFDRQLIYAGPPAPIEIVPETREVNTYWRIYVRVVGDAQNGMLGEPLRRMPWDFAARSSGDVEVYERGGRLKDTIPTGYYVDLTQIAADYGWQNVPALRGWQSNFSAIQYWEFHKTDGLSWNAAMLELYTPQQLQDFFVASTPVPAPPPLPTPSPTPDRDRTPTPIPPDLQQ